MSSPPSEEATRLYVAEKVDPVISALVTRLVREQPEDVLAFVGEWCRSAQAEAREADPDVAAERKVVAEAYVAQEDRPVTPPGTRRIDMSPPKEKRVFNFSGSVGGGAAGGTTAAPVSQAERRAAAVAAAERRNQNNNGPVSVEKRQEIARDNKRQAMVGKVRALYSQSGMDEPFGLGMATEETLQKLYKKMGAQTVHVFKENAREGAARNIIKT